jgi:5'-nucleotidase
VSSSVTDISTPTQSPNYAPVQPVYDTAPSQPVSTGSYASGSGISSVTAGSYVVKKGDTLYAIARQRYGDGKQWQKIASANPGLSPTSLKVGQTINIP